MERSSLPQGGSSSHYHCEGLSYHREEQFSPPVSEIVKTADLEKNLSLKIFLKITLILFCVYVRDCLRITHAEI